MERNFSNRTSTNGNVEKLEGQKIPKRYHFHYLGLIICKDGDVSDDVIHRIKAGWIKWRNATGVLCDQRIPVK